MHDTKRQALTKVYFEGEPQRQTVAGQEGRERRAACGDHKGLWVNLVPSQFTMKSHFSCFQAVGSFLFRMGQPKYRLHRLRSGPVP